MKKITIFVLVISLMMIALGSFGALAEEKPVKIGLLAPLTGPSSRLGKDLVGGAKIAVAELNAGGGVLGRPLKLIVEDTESRPKAGVDAAHKLVEVDNVVAVTGTYSSGIGLPVSKYLNDVGVPYITTVTTDKIREVGPWVFDVAGNASHRSPPLVKFALQDSGTKKFGLFFMDNPIGRSDGESSKKYLKEIGGEVVVEIYYKMYKKDYKSELMKLMQADPPAILYEGYSKETKIQMKQLNQMGYTNRSHFYTFELAGVTSASIPKTVEGMKGVSFAATGPKKEFLFDTFKEKYGHEPITPYAAAFYDSVLITGLAIDRAGSLDKAKVRDALYPVSAHYYGASGDGFRGFDELGMQASECFVTQVYRDGKVQPYVGEGMDKPMSCYYLQPVKFFQKVKDEFIGEQEG